MIIKISSKDNPSFKYAKKLSDKSSFRKKEEKFIVEGVREIDLCLKSNFTIESIFTSGDNQNKFSDTGIKTYEITQDLLKKIIPILETDYKLLTTSLEQRESFRSHIIIYIFVNSIFH